MMKIREKLSQRKNAMKLAIASLTPVFIISANSLVASAAESSVDTTSIRNTMKSSFTSIGNDILGFFGDILPIALPILGAGLVIGVGLAIFKKVTKKSAS